MMLRHALIITAVGCASSRVPPVRFANAPIVEIVDDRRDVPKPPAPRDTPLGLYYFDGTFHRLLTRTLELPRPRRALGVNALDEVPDSTWFTNRIGVRDLTLEELRAGPTVVGSPEPHTPWKILSSKVGGKSVGFVIVDARGEKFLLKFDPAGFPEAETAADAITNRLLWAFGYNVPEDHVIYVRRDDLVLAPGATTKNPLGAKVPLSRAALDRRLAEIEVAPDGRIRGIASHMLAGKWLGGHPGEGVRGDDPNDRIPHELRRDLRGQYAMFAWLDHNDVKEHNTIDMWVADPAEPSRHYVRHYLIDFGKSLGFMAASKRDPRTGHAYTVDYGEMLGSLVSAGLRLRAWETREAPTLRGVGLYEASSYDPAGWKASTQVYLPLLTADRFDKFWGAKILIRFTREQLRAVVETARLTDPRATDYLVDTLVTRQRATARHWFSVVNPLDDFAVVPSRRGHALCFDDLALAHQLESPLVTQYRLARYDRAGDPLGEPIIVRPGATSRTCPPIALGTGADSYTMVRIDTTRPGLAAGTIVHIARDPITRVPRVIGLWRP
jgi:hypothetical protein